MRLGSLSRVFDNLKSTDVFNKKLSVVRCIEYEKDFFPLLTIDKINFIDVLISSSNTQCTWSSIIVRTQISEEISANNRKLLNRSGISNFSRTTTSWSRNNREFCFTAIVRSSLLAFRRWFIFCQFWKLIQVFFLSFKQISFKKFFQSLWVK